MWLRSIWGGRALEPSATPAGRSSALWKGGTGEDGVKWSTGSTGFTGFTRVSRRRCQAMKLSAVRSSQTTPAVNPAPQIQGQFERDVQDISLPVWQQGEQWDNDGRRWLHAIPSSLRWDAAAGRQLAADHVLVASRFQPHQYQTVVPGEARRNRQSGDEADLFPAPRRRVAACFHVRRRFLFPGGNPPRHQRS